MEKYEKTLADKKIKLIQMETDVLSIMMHGKTDCENCSTKSTFDGIRKEILT